LGSHRHQQSDANSGVRQRHPPIPEIADLGFLAVPRPMLKMNFGGRHVDIVGRAQLDELLPSAHRLSRAPKAVTCRCGAGSGGLNMLLRMPAVPCCGWENRARR